MTFIIQTYEHYVDRDVKCSSTEDNNRYIWWTYLVHQSTYLNHLKQLVFLSEPNWNPGSSGCAHKIFTGLCVSDQFLLLFFSRGAFNFTRFCYMRKTLFNFSDFTQRTGKYFCDKIFVRNVIRSTYECKIEHRSNEMIRDALLLPIIIFSAVIDINFFQKSCSIINSN